jgi:hypothetical protein
VTAADDEVTGMTLSPDGQRLAVVYRPGFGGFELRLSDVLTGQSRTWTLPDSLSAYVRQVPSWLADNRTLEFEAGPTTTTNRSVRVALLDTGESGSFAADSRIATIPAFPGGSPGQALVTADGQHAIETQTLTGQPGSGEPGRGEALVIDLATGGARRLGEPGLALRVVWADPSGRAAVVARGQYSQVTYAIVTPDAETPLQLAPGVISAAW